MITFRFRASGRGIFDDIRKGKKRVETRAASIRYENIRAGDTIRFLCGKIEFKKKVQRVIKFKSIAALLKSYSPRDINPSYKSEAELRKMFASFTGYGEKIKKFGLIAMELE